MDYLTADTHFGHANIIKYSKRPFSSVEEMDRQFIENVNTWVGEKDRLFHMGDFAFKHALGVEDYLKKIRCKNVFLILGNHDKHLKQWEKELFAGCDKAETLNTISNGEKREIFLFHYSCRVWDKSHHGTCHAWGHSHGSLDDDPNARSMDVGVDNVARLLSADGVNLLPQDYRPISVDEFFGYTDKKNWKPIDHHGRDKEE